MNLRLLKHIKLSPPSITVCKLLVLMLSLKPPSKERFISGPSSKVESLLVDVVMKTRSWVPGHAVSAVRKQRVANAYSQFTVSLLFCLGLQTMKWYHPHSGESSHLHQSSSDSSSWACPEACLLGHSRPVTLTFLPFSSRICTVS